METSPSHPLLDSLQNVLNYFQPAIKELAMEVIEKNISSHPIFIAHQTEISLGELVLDKNDFKTDWSISATLLEEMVERNIILPEKEEAFKEVYKNPKEFMCVFLISEKGGNFIFYPYNSSNFNYEFSITNYEPDL